MNLANKTGLNSSSHLRGMSILTASTTPNPELSLCSRTRIRSDAVSRALSPISTKEGSSAVGRAPETPCCAAGMPSRSLAATRWATSQVRKGAPIILHFHFQDIMRPDTGPTEGQCTCTSWHAATLVAQPAPVPCPPETIPLKQAPRLLEHSPKLVDPLPGMLAIQQQFSESQMRTRPCEHYSPAYQSRCRQEA